MPLATLSHTAAATASQAVAARKHPAAASQAVRAAVQLPRRARSAACAAAAAPLAAPCAAADRAALPSRRAFLNGALKVSVASASLLSSIEDIAEAAPMHRSLSAAALAADAVHSPRAAAAGSLERSAAREFDHASMLPLPLKPFGGGLSGGSAPASLAAAPSPVHQPQSAATAQDDVPSRRRRAVVVNLALSACPLSGMASDGLFSQLVDAAADHGMDRLAAALPCVALPLAGLLWSQQLMGCMQPVQRPQAQEPALVLA
ncbi:hypothetical protein COHA_007725 [Chlorella ohadii]|uniref:Uncharacterized protein n=1 Tax=Chlorella ohadii TaxID=2649997 RepID=A0AAD5H3X0_9CHLO|nr:hypothetical protein COHA_007725 [Chlorella ohadii]